MKYLIILSALMFAGCFGQDRCVTITEILACGNDECRVVVDNARRITVSDLVVLDDVVLERVGRQRGFIHSSCPQNK